MTLKVTIADAMLDHNTEVGGIMKPYVVLRTRDSEHKSKISSGRNPSWGQSILISTRQQDITLEVFDSERGIDDTIGHAFVKVASLIGNPYVPEQRIITLGYQNMKAGQLRLIVEYIEGKQHIGGLTSFQSKLMMAGPGIQPPTMQSSGMLQSNPGMLQSNPGMLQSGGMFNSGLQGIPQAPPTMLTSGQQNIPQTQMSNFSGTHGIPPMNNMTIGSNFQMPPPSQQFIVNQQQNLSMLRSQQGPGGYPPTSSQIIDPRMTAFNPIQQFSDPIMAGGMQNSILNGFPTDPYNPIMTSQRGIQGGNITIAGGTPSTINQAFGTRRMPIFKLGCPNHNWFSILDGDDKPSQCLPPRLI